MYEREHLMFVFNGLQDLTQELFFSSFIYLPTNFIISLVIADYYYIVHMHHIFINHSSVDGYLRWFDFLAIVSRAAMDMDEQYLCTRI